jgi:hypothetical protein
MTFTSPIFKDPMGEPDQVTVNPDPKEILASTEHSMNQSTPNLMEFKGRTGTSITDPPFQRRACSRPPPSHSAKHNLYKTQAHQTNFVEDP